MSDFVNRRLGRVGLDEADGMQTCILADISLSRNRDNLVVCATKPPAPLPRYVLKYLKVHDYV